MTRNRPFQDPRMLFCPGSYTDGSWVRRFKTRPITHTRHMEGVCVVAGSKGPGNGLTHKYAQNVILST